MGRLQNLTEDFKEKQLKDIAQWIVKYQKFKIKIALEKLDTTFCSKYTLKNYLVRGLKYLKTREKTGGVNNSLYDYIDDELQKHTQPLQPTLSQRKQAYTKNYAKRVINHLLLLLKKLKNHLQLNLSMV